MGKKGGGEEAVYNYDRLIDLAFSKFSTNASFQLTVPKYFWPIYDLI